MVSRLSGLDTGMGWPADDGPVIARSSCWRGGHDLAPEREAGNEPGPPTGAPGTGIQLAGYVETGPQTLPGDSAFHAAWSMTFTAGTNQLFIMTGNIGSFNAGCAVDQQVTIDGVPDPTALNGGLLTFSPGAHTIAYELRADCPIDVAPQQGVLIPFTKP
ncbi:MAG: hypothetical protein ABI783_12040 [Actinomycetota bacterium]